MNALSFTLNKYTWIAVSLTLAILASCSSGKKALERGDYETSIAKAVNRLRQSPKNGKARSTLRKAYPLALSYYQTRVAQQKGSSSALKWEPILRDYRILNAMYSDMQRCPACLSVVPSPQNFQFEEEEARQKAAHARFELGQEALNRRNREDAKTAYREFIKVRELQQNYPNIDNAIAEAKMAATISVILEKVPVYTRRYQISDEYFSNKMFEFLKQNRRMSDFVDFYTPVEAVSQQLNNPDHVIRMQFDDFTVGQEYVKETIEEVSRDSVVVGQVEVEGQSRDVYGTVKAKVSTFEKTVTSAGLLDLKIYDAHTNELLLQEKFNGEFVWTSAWGNYKGDERALSREQQAICELEEVPPPAAEDLFIEFSRPIYEQVTSRLRRFYKNY